jgi:hypothetical protein
VFFSINGIFNAFPFPQILAHLKPDSAWLLFKELVYDAFKANVRDTILGLIQRERDGEPQDRMLLKNAVQV